MSRPLSLRLYAAATRVASPLLPVLLAARARRGKEDPTRLHERLGRPAIPRPAGGLVWLHAVSVGESLSLLPLIERLRLERPSTAVLVTSGTTTAAALLRDRLPAGALHQYAPVDTPGAAARFLDYWRPAAAVFVESELWPNLILAAKARGIRLALVSAGMSAKASAGWGRVPAAARAVLSAFDVVLARNDAAADRLRALGARIDGLADLKFGADALPVDEAGLAALRGVLAGRRVILAASTHAGEEEVVIEACAPRASTLLVIAPRHPQRGADVAALAQAKGLRVGRRSFGDDPAGLDVYVADTLGEMGLWYRLADRAVIGGSLVPGVGGHNPLEAARLGCPFVAGEHVEAWPIYHDLVAAGATRLVKSANLATALFADTSKSADFARDVVAARDRAAHNALTRIIALAPDA